MNEALSPLITAVLIVLLIVLGVGGVTLVVIGWQKIQENRAKIEQAVKDIVVQLPEGLQEIINTAIKIGADYAESIDLDGQLDELIDEFVDKSEVKLMVALDAAIKYLETMLKAAGYEIDIPEEVIKNLIQVYVFNNRDRYPSGDATETEVK